MKKLLLSLTVVLSLSSQANGPDNECEKILAQYRTLVARAAQTETSTGASLAQKLMLAQLENQLRVNGYTDEQIARERSGASKIEDIKVAEAVFDAEATEQAIQMMQFQTDENVLIPILANKDLPIHVRARAASILFSSRSYDRKYNSVHTIMEYIQDLNPMAFIRSLAAQPRPDERLHQMLHSRSLPNITWGWSWTFDIPLRLKFPVHEKWRPGASNVGKDSMLSSQFIFEPPNDLDKLKLDYLIPNWYSRLNKGYQVSYLIADEFLLEIAQALGMDQVVAAVAKRKEEVLLNPEEHGEELEQAISIYAKEEASPFTARPATRKNWTNPFPGEFRRVLENYVKGMVDGSGHRAIQSVFASHAYNLDQLRNWIAEKGDEASKLNFMVEVNLRLPYFARVLATQAPLSLRKQAAKILASHPELQKEGKRYWQTKLLIDGPLARRVTESRILTIERPHVHIELYRHKTHRYIEARVLVRSTGEIRTFNLSEDLYGKEWEGRVRASAYYRLVAPWTYDGFINFIHIPEYPGLGEEANAFLIGQKVGKKIITVELQSPGGMSWDETILLAPFIQTNGSSGHIKAEAILE